MAVVYESTDSLQGWRMCAQTDPELFFPARGESPREAKRLCAVCDVRAECLELALRTDQRWGVWGGTSENERRKLRRSARQASRS